MINVDELRNAPVAILGGGAVGKPAVRIAHSLVKRFAFAIWIPSLKKL